MKALVFNGPNDISVKEVPRPSAGPGDLVVKVSLSTICGTDLHIWHGHHPARRGVVLGHEIVGTVAEVGEGTMGFRVGERVAVSCITNCGKCYFCKEKLYSHCEKAGWQMGYTMDGSHAEYVRVPYAEAGVYRIPDGLKDEEVIFVGDALSTGYLGAEKAEIHPGDTVVVFGSGPVGLCTQACAKLWSPAMLIAVDRDDARLDAARSYGADETLNPRRDDVPARIRELTGGRGADAAIEVVGVKETLLSAIDSVRKGGIVSSLGIYEQPVEIPMEKLCEYTIQVRTSLATTSEIPRLIKLIEKGMIDVSHLLTHTFPLDEAVHAFEFFDRKSDGALKVGITPA